MTSESIITLAEKFSELAVQIGIVIIEIFEI